MNKATKLLLAAIYRNRYQPLAPHHAAAIKERLAYMSDDEIDDFILTGKQPHTIPTETQQDSAEKGE